MTDERYTISVTRDVQQFGQNRGTVNAFEHNGQGYREVRTTLERLMEWIGDFGDHSTVTISTRGAGGVIVETVTATIHLED